VSGFAGGFFCAHEQWLEDIQQWLYNRVKLLFCCCECFRLPCCMLRTSLISDLNPSKTEFIDVSLSLHWCKVNTSRRADYSSLTGWEQQRMMSSTPVLSQVLQS